MNTNILNIAQTLNAELKENGMRISLIPDFRIKFGIFNLIEKGQNSPLLSDEDGNEILCFEDIAGDYSDEPDDNLLEVLLDDESISFWTVIIAEEFNENPEYVVTIVDAMKKAQTLGFRYLRFRQH